MDNYRFKLQKYVPNNKVNCPACGRKRCAVKYYDMLGEIEFPDEVCICDHVQSCGYHYPPRDYLHDHPEVAEKLKEDYSSVRPSDSHRAQPAFVEERPVSFIDEEIVMKSMASYGCNPLFRFLSAKFGKEEVEKVFRMYHVGTSRQWNGATVYWYQDADGHYRTGKVMGYNPADGHRIKEPYNQVTWVHSLLKLPDFNMQLCLFGEHLLADRPDSEVILVEAEKTCLIAAHFLPDYVWLATGGLKNGFKPEVISVLKDRKVTLFPDLGCFDEWSKHLPLLESVCRHASVSTYLESLATDEQRAKGLDIGDFLLHEETKREILSRMIAHNPAIQLLVDKLGLEIVEEN